jgi:Ni,Fe-hydrogenase III small subunit/formate hydrogenlyase subunit 6/NADH:ubiquinone oxidoreductase subunit I
VWKILLARARQGDRTLRFPEAEPALPERFRGAPVLDAARCRDACRACVEACPTDALSADSAGPALDVGRCLFCAECVTSCPEGAIRFSGDPRMATRRREDLIVRERAIPLARALDERSRRIFGRSLRLRQVSAGGCNGCEADVAVLQTIVFDLSRFGIQFVASPRHADGLLVTGPVTRNMQLALEKTFAAVPEPKFVIAVGACAISGGPFVDHPEVRNGAASLVPVDLFVPGCPPHPLTILDGLLRLLGRIEDGPSAAPRPGAGGSRGA